MRWLIVVAGLSAGMALAGTPYFVPLAADGIHDPEGPAIDYLQQPVEALGPLPLDSEGHTDWMAALRGGSIAPRAGVTGKEKMKGIDLDIVMTNTSSLSAVKFPHRAHTEWLTCSNCHSQIFLPQKGGNFITMAAILQGEYCGVCHGKVAFPPTTCSRCHNTPTTRAGLR
ncbi:MAG TPA: c(7)-type cytochrome triheme domain-containing protein [Gammaproteobacteria bacterium]